MSVEFRKLGDVAVQVDGYRLDIARARQRCVLVALLIEVHHPVPVDRLVDHAWSDRPPRNARNSLAGYVPRLRNLLAAADGVVICREPGDRCLRLTQCRWTLHVFKHVAREARACPEPGHAAELFDQALEIWLGEPIFALDTPWINNVRNAAAGERLSVVLDRNDAALLPSGSRGS